MKKTISILAAVMMVLSFAGMASALDAVNCAGDGKYIKCGESYEQVGTECTVFDFENRDDYCGYKQPNRAVFPICDCVPDFFEAVTTQQEYGISMEIMVDKHDGKGPQAGDNFVYWSGSNADSDLPMSVRVFNREGEACSVTGTTVKSYTNTNMIRQGTFGTYPTDYNFMLANGDSGAPAETPCPPADPCGTCVDTWRVVELALDDAVTGFVTTAGDSTNWVINIPQMWAEFPSAQRGWTVYVEVCFNQRGSLAGSTNICTECNCCFMLEIGSLCCEEDESADCALTFPYLPKTSSYWYGMAVTNTSSVDGTATVMLYENDGDTATGTVTVPANSTKVIMTSDLTAAGTIGDSQAYANVKTNFKASGFAMMAKESNGVSMGYLAEKCGDCGCDD